MTGGDEQAIRELADEQLLQHYRGGGADAERAFEMLVERYQQELFYFLLRFTGKRAAADDLFQETFLQIHISAETFDPTRRFKPWLFTIAANKARDLLRKNRRQATMSLSADLTGSGGAGSGGGDSSGGGSFLDLLEADLPLPDEQVLSGEQRELVRKAVDSLPDHLREVLILAYFNKLAYKEIAESLSIPLGTVKSRLHAAVATFGHAWATRCGSNHPLEAE